MKIYTWKTSTKKGEISTKNIHFARAILHQQGVNNARIYLKINWHYREKIKPAEITKLLQQLSTLLSANIDIIQAFDIIQKNSHSKPMKQLSQQISNKLQEGYSLANIFSESPKHFNTLTQQLIAVGESSGNLENILTGIVQQREANKQIKQKIKSALIYPVILMITSIVIIFIMMIFVIPQLKSLYDSFGAQLPWLTQSILSIASGLRRHLMSLYFCCLTLPITHLLLYKHCSRYKTTVSFLLFKLPIIGDIFKKNILIRCCKTLHITLNAGLPLMQCLTASKNISNNIHYQNQWQNIIHRVNDGFTLASGMKNTFYFPFIMQQFINLGETTGTLETMLEKISTIFAGELNQRISYMNTLFEPFIMLFLSLIIGTLIVAMYLPIFRLGNIL